MIVPKTISARENVDFLARLTEGNFTAQVMLKLWCILSVAHFSGCIWYYCGVATDEREDVTRITLIASSDCTLDDSTLYIITLYNNLDNPDDPDNP